MELVNIGDPTSGVAAKVNASGQLAVSNQSFNTELTTGTITSSTGVVSANVVGYPTVNFTIHGTYAGVNVTFEASDDNTNWYPIQCARSDSTANELTSGVLTANTLRAWSANIIGFSYFRVRATAWTSGTATINLTAVATSTEPNPMVTIGGDIPTLPTTISSGTVNLGTGCGLQTTLYTNSTLAASTNSSTATMNYCEAVTFFLTATGAAAGTVQVYGSSDNTTFFPIPGAGAIAVTTSATSTVLSLPPCRYYRFQSTTALSALYAQFQGVY
jgi:hypothetical protein